MTDDLDPPQRSGSGLAEHGGDTDPISHTSRRRLAAMAAVAAAVLAVGVPVALVNRQSAAQPLVAGTAAAPGAEPPMVPPMVPPVLPSSSQTSGPAPATPAALMAPKGRPDADGCPVSAARLMTALLRSDVSDRVAPTADLSDVDCYGTYALGRTEPVNADPVMVVFRYSALTETWEALGAGTSGYCDRIVPAAVRAHLERCR